MSDSPHDHARPDRAAQQSTLDVARAILDRDMPAAREAISAAACPSCVAVASLQFGFALCSVFAGAAFITEPLRLRLLGLVDAAERELRGAPN